ncbi:MAG: maleylacetate reductase [Xanthobacteraceae bacterium]
MSLVFTYDPLPQRVVFFAGALARVTEEAERLGISRALVVATPGRGARLGERVMVLLGNRAAALHPHAVIHVPRPVAEAGLAAARSSNADGIVAVGGGSAIGLAKYIARDTGKPILAIPTTYSGSEVTSIWGMSEGERKTTGRDAKVLPRTVIYDPELTYALPAAVIAASAMDTMAHCVSGLWLADRTPVTVANATEAMRRFGAFLPRAVANGHDIEARGECLIASWLAGTVLTAGTGLNHKLAHVLGGYGLPHAETHAVLLPHTTRFNLAAGGDVPVRLSEALHDNDPAGRLERMLAPFGIAKSLRQFGFDANKISDAASQIAALNLKDPRPVSQSDAENLLRAAL